MFFEGYEKLIIKRGTDRVPAGFIVTGPNIASQDLLFSQLSERLSTKINGPVATLRSGEASNLKMLLKKLIRDVTNQRSTEDGEEEHFSEQDVSYPSILWTLKNSH